MATADRRLEGRTILAIFAHPDDESIACGGTLARAVDAGARVILFCASRGEAGSTSDPALVPDGDLGRVRTAELQDAAGVLGVTELIVRDYADGALRWKDESELLRELIATIERYRPDAIITFAEDGLSWHLDHIGMHEHTCDAVLTFGAAAPPLYYVTLPHGVMRAVVEAAHTKGGAPPDSSLWGIAPDTFGLHAHPPGIVVDIREWIPRKLAAIRCHRTQMGRNNPLAWIDEEDARRWLGLEHFRRAPLESRGDLILEQLGEPVASS